MNSTDHSTDLLQSAFDRFEQTALNLTQNQEALQREVTKLEKEKIESRRRRLEALGRMAAELAHEVRNPLGSIRLFAEMLLEDLKGQPDRQEIVQHILEATSGLGSTVNNLLSFASPSECTPRPFDLAGVAREACALLSPSCRLRDIRLIGPSMDENIRILADPEGFRQVTLNLLGNAIAATEAGGQVRINAWHEKGWTVLEVADTGKGIAAEDMNRVFDPFFSRTEGGSGLGLSIVDGIVERHDGKVGLESEQGVGTTVTVRVPTRPARSDDGTDKGELHD